MLNNEEVYLKIKKFVETNKKRWNNDTQDFKLSKNIAAGDGFTVRQDNTDVSMKKLRTRVCTNLLEPLINTIVYKFTEDPFEFKTTAPIDNNELTFQLSDCLREACQDGISYLLCYVDDNKINFQKLNNLNIMYGECKYNDGTDVEEVIYVDKRKKKKDDGIQEKMNKLFIGNIDLQPNESMYLTYYRKEGEKVEVYKIFNDEIEESDTIDSKYIPIVRIYGKTVPKMFDKSFRGFYYIVKDQLKDIDISMSRMQERIKCAPSPLFMAGKTAVGTDVEKFAKINGAVSAVLTYNDRDANGQPLDKPEYVIPDFGIADLPAAIELNRSIISEILGVSAGEPVKNETAEAVLLRREAKDVAQNEMLKNLLDSANHIADIIIELSFTDCEVVDSLFIKMKKMENMEKLIALTQLLQQNPGMYATLPFIIDKMDLDENEKIMLWESIQRERQPSQAEQQLQMQNQGLSQQVNDLSRSLDNLINTNKLNIENTVVKEEGLDRRKQWDLEMKAKDQQLEELKIRLDALEKGIKLNIDNKEEN